jgi:hypothetical protein
VNNTTKPKTIINVDIMLNGSIVVTGHPTIAGINNDEYTEVIVTDCRTLTDTAQYNIGWHDGYRAQFNEANTKRHNDAEERMRQSATENNPGNRPVG